MSLGERIRKRRQILKITQQGLAQTLGVTPQHISAIEQDKGAPSLALLPKLAEELGVSVDYLLSGKEGIIIDVIPAIKADKRLNLKAKRALIAMVEELWRTWRKGRHLNLEAPPLKEKGTPVVRLMNNTFPWQGEGIKLFKSPGRGLDFDHRGFFPDDSQGEPLFVYRLHNKLS